MKKLALQLDDLKIETFATGEQQPTVRGTVEGHYGTNHSEVNCTALYTYCNGVECY